MPSGTSCKDNGTVFPIRTITGSITITEEAAESFYIPPHFLSQQTWGMWLSLRISMWFYMVLSFSDRNAESTRIWESSAIEYRGLSTPIKAVIWFLTHTGTAINR